MEQEKIREGEKEGILFGYDCSSKLVCSYLSVIGCGGLVQCGCGCSKTLVSNDEEIIQKFDLESLLPEEFYSTMENSFPKFRLPYFKPAFSALILDKKAYLSVLEPDTISLRMFYDLAICKPSLYSGMTFEIMRQKFEFDLEPGYGYEVSTQIKIYSEKELLEGKLFSIESFNLEEERIKNNGLLAIG